MLLMVRLNPKVPSNDEFGKIDKEFLIETMRIIKENI